jgi:hypothetical protein
MCCSYFFAPKFQRGGSNLNLQPAICNISRRSFTVGGENETLVFSPVRWWLTLMMIHVAVIRFRTTIIIYSCCSWRNHSVCHLPRRFRYKTDIESTQTSRVSQWACSVMYWRTWQLYKCTIYPYCAQYNIDKSNTGGVLGRYKSVLRQYKVCIASIQICIKAIQICIEGIHIHLWRGMTQSGRRCCGLSAIPWQAGECWEIHNLGLYIHYPSSYVGSLSRDWTHDSMLERAIVRTNDKKPSLNSQNRITPLTEAW